MGFSVLDLSKLLMYQFHYEHMLKSYQKIDMCFTDTDSLLYETETQTVYDDMLRDQDLHDVSDYPTDHPNYSELESAWKV